MRASALDPFLTSQATSTGTGNVQSLTIPRSTSAVEITAETTAARVTFDNSTPSSGNGVVFPINALPTLVPLRGRAPDAIKFTSTAAANSVVNVAWFA
jgi:hypothetical protein